MDELRDLIGASTAIEGLRTSVQRLTQISATAPRPPAVLITGETGTGKGLVARLLHRVGPRAAGPFVDVNCAAIPETLLEPELFGYERGAFTDARQAKPGLFQAAHRGTMFLDEIGLLGESLQAKLLKVLEDRSVRRLGATRSEPVDTWIISATNADLGAEMRERRFREDVYHRLAVVTLAVPPLRDRDGDVVILAEHFLARACRDYGLPPRKLSPAARHRLLAHAWPGNVRELANVMERAALMSGRTVVDVESLNLSSEDLTPLAAPPEAPEVVVPRDVGRSRDEVMAAHFQAVLDECGGNISRAAVELGLARNTLRTYIQKYGLRVPGGRARPAAIPESRPGEPARQPASRAADREERAADAAPVPAASSRALQWDRRLVASLAIALSHPPDMEAFYLSPLLEQMLGTVQAFGGRVEDLSPVGLVAAFGADGIEDAPRRAAYAALATRAASGRDPGERPVECRVALHVQPSLVATDAGALVDARDRRETERELDRLLASASPGTIALSTASGPHFERRFELAADPGRPDALALVGPERSGFDVGGGLLSRFAGREREIEMLRDRLARAELGAGQVIGILGEPGVGKSRLLREFRRQAGPGDVTFLTGRCLPYATAVPYLPIVDVIRAAFRVSDTDPLETAADKIHAGLRDLDGIPDEGAPLVLRLLGFRPAADALATQSPEAIRTRTIGLLRQLVLLAGRRRPVVLAVEDLQWIDRTSEAVLDALVDGLGSGRVLLLATYRPGYQPSWLGKSYASQLALGRLTRDESAAVLDSILPAGSVPDSSRDRIVARAEGNPLFIEELARATAEDESDAPDGAVPDTIEGVLASRLNRLAERDRELLQAAAVIGRDVGVPILGAVSHRADDELRIDLIRLESAEFLHGVATTSRSAVSFKHALTHEVTYRSVPDARRRRLHGAAAAAIRRLMPEIAERRPEMLAHHHTQAGQVQEAIGAWHQAGQRAIQGSANAEAIAHITTALGLLETLPPGAPRNQQELALRLTLVSALSAPRGYSGAEVAAALDRVRAIVEELGDAPALAPVRFGLWRFYLSRAELSTARDFAARVLAAGDAHGDDALRVAGHLATGVCHFYGGGYVAAVDHLDRSLALGQPSHGAAQLAVYGQHLGVAARGYLAWFLTIMGQVDRAADEGARALAIARELNHPFTLALALATVAMHDGERGDTRQLASRGSELVALSRDQGFSFFTGMGLFFTGWAALRSGDPAAGAATMRQGAETYRSVQHRAGLRLRAQLAEALLEIDADEEARTTLDEALAQAREAGEGAAVPELHRVRARLLSRGHPDDPAVDEHLRRAIALAREQGAWLHALRSATELARCERRRGAPGPAAAALREIRERFPADLALPDLRAARELEASP